MSTFSRASRQCTYLKISHVMNKQLDSLEEIQRKHELSIKRLVMDIKLTAYAVKDIHTFFTSVTNPHQKIYIDEGYSPLHARARFMVDQLKSKHHCLFMDNLYMSAMFTRRLVSCEKRLKFMESLGRIPKGCQCVCTNMKLVMKNI